MCYLGKFHRFTLLCVHKLAIGQLGGQPYSLPLSLPFKQALARCLLIGSNIWLPLRLLDLLLGKLGLGFRQSAAYQQVDCDL